MKIGSIYINITTQTSAQVLSFSDTQVTYEMVSPVNGEVNEYQSSIDRFEQEHELTN